MLESTRIGLKVDVDTLRGTREGVPRLMALLGRLGLDATFYFSVGPDNTGRAMRRVFRKGFPQKVARTSVLKHYGLRTLLYGVLLPGPDIAEKGGAHMRAVRDAGFEGGLHTYDHVRWQSNAHALALEQEYGLRYASDTRGGPAFRPMVNGGASTCTQLPTTLPTFDELLGRDGVDEASIADAVFDLSAAAADPSLQVFTLHAELEGMLLLDAFEALLLKWRSAGAAIVRMAAIHSLATKRELPVRAVIQGEIPGRSGLLAVQAPAMRA